MRFIALIELAFVVIAAFAQAAATLPQSPTPATGKAAADRLIPWLLDEDQQMRGIPFSELIFDTTGKKVLPFKANNAVDQRVAKVIGAACDETMKRLNAPDSAIQHVDRINEVSSYFDGTLRQLLNATPGLQCDFPVTADGKLQRSGYVSPIWRANACSIWTRNFTPPEAATAVSEHFISSLRSRLTKCATTRCISSLDLSMHHGM